MSITRLVVLTSHVSFATVIGLAAPANGQEFRTARTVPTQTADGGVVADVVRVELVAVIPFTNISRDAADEWLGDGIAATVAADFETHGSFTVVPRERIATALQLERGQLDDAGVTVLGRALGSRWVVTGGYQRLGDQVRITARLVDSQSGALTRTAKVDGAFHDIFDLQDQIARELTDTGRLGARSPTSSSAPAASVPSGEDEGGLDRALLEPARRLPEPGVVSGGRVLPPDDPLTRFQDTTGGRSRRAGGDGDAAQASLPRGSGRPRADGAQEAPGVGSMPGRPGVVSLGEAASAGVLAGRPSVTAVRVDEPPRIDGNLDDAVWQQATRITDFVQQGPIEGAPATEETEVFVAYDDSHLYFGIYAHYSDPSLVRATRVDRDQAMFGDDIISVYFDTFLDQQRAYVFSLNGYGVQNDSLMEAAGGGGRGGGGGGRRGGGFSGGGRGGFTGVPFGDRSWDALFDSGGTLVDDGWTAEMSIPFKSLRYPAVGNQPHRWGFQIARRIRGKDDTDVWSPLSRAVSGFMPQMGTLNGLSGLSTSRNLEILPTVTAVQVGNLDTTSGAFPRESQPEGGVNLKYGLTSNLTLDFTYNPDFSQIESDRPQIEVNQRFPLFFSELRPFFLEGQEIFGIQGPVTLVHTRTIVDPRYGGKVTGKVGKTTLGLLVANDEGPGNLDDISDPIYGKSANVLIGRVRYDLYSESHIGAILTNREFLDGHSRLAGVDGNFRLNDATSLGFRAITSQNRDLDRLDTSGNMFDVTLQSQGRNLNYFLGSYSIAPEFDTAVGFVRRRDIRAVGSSVGYRWWPESWLINWGPSFNYSRNWDFEDVLEDEMAQASVNMSFVKNIRFGVGVNRDMERFGGINFDKTSYRMNLSVRTLQAISFGSYYSYGDQIRYGGAPFLGTGGNGGLFMTVRPLSRLQSQINVNASNLVDPLDDSEVFNVKIYRALTTYQFTDRLLLRNILEYNTFNRTVGANVLFTYRINSGTVFFIGYDDHYQQGDLILDQTDEFAYLGNTRFFTTDLLRTNRAFFTKISYLFRY